MPTLSQDIIRHADAGFPLLFVEALGTEPERFVQGLSDQITANNKKVRGKDARKAHLFYWDYSNPDKVFDRTSKNSYNVEEPSSDPYAAAMADPLPKHVLAVKWFRQYILQRGEEEQCLLVMPNAHKFQQQGEPAPVWYQHLRNTVMSCRQTNACIIFTGPRAPVDDTLDRVMKTIQAKFPDRDEVQAIIESLFKANKLEAPSKDMLNEFADAASGLTQQEIEDVLSLEIISRDDNMPTSAGIWDAKAELVKQTGALSFGDFGVKFKDIGGLDAMKSFLHKMITSKSKIQAKGALILGVPGSGKSLIAKALGNETGRPTVCLDMGAIFGSFVGESEAKIRAALRAVEAISPCILFIDEIEKGLAGGGGSGSTDGGVTRRVFGTFLTWLNDHKSDVFVIATCNNISSLPPEFARAERWDVLFFVDIPNWEQQKRIWDISISQCDLSGSYPEADLCYNWTGAEINTCCRIAGRMGVSIPEAATNITPMYVTAYESIEGLRKWATDRCIDANKGGRYNASAEVDEANGQIGARKLRK